MRSTRNVECLHRWYYGHAQNRQVTHTHPAVPYMTHCDNEQADDTKSLRLHLQGVILTTEQCRRNLQMMQNIVSREAMLAVCKQTRTDSFKRSESVLSSIHPWSPCHLLRHPVPLALGFQ